MKQNYNTHFMAAIVTLHETSDPQLNKRRVKILFCCTLLVLGLLTSITATAQQGYIYVHKQALDESSSVNSTFTVTGGSTSVTPFQLNDQPAQVNIADIGSSQNGRLWAVDVNDKLYYRNSGSSQWVLTNVTAKKVDGGPGGDCYFINGGSQVFRYDGTTATKIGDPLSGSNWGNGVGLLSGDICNGWDGNPYIITDQGKIFRFTNLWVQLNPSTNNRSLDEFVDGSGSILVAKSDFNIYKISSTGVETNLGRPSSASASYYPNDVGVDDQGNIYAIYWGSNGASVYKWVSGTSWTASEQTSIHAMKLTGGVGKQMWMSTAYTYYQNIFARSTNGINIIWIEDELVRTNPVGNAAMIAVSPGTYTITETVPSGWDLYDITVNDPTSNSSKNIQSNTATLVVGAGETVNVIFQSGLVNTPSKVPGCGTAGRYIETFGTGAACTYGTPLIGQTSYHFDNTTNGTPPEGGYNIVGNSINVILQIGLI
ncbi:hypothetical protein ACFFJX_18965 [Pseudarcicella hirudinis]|uniref:prealbumin-like fold domain-containing protein n=1 Tax=Pseudarcicella hirudinis TaxID=1079859 RepID=UPI0035E75BC0